jgi:hypothetical protein
MCQKSTKPRKESEIMKNLPSFETYGNYKSDNYGANALKFYVGNVTVYFSYKTPVAFHTYETGLIVRENDWGPTTGKHLNWIDDGNKADRVSGTEFESALELALSPLD